MHGPPKNRVMRLASVSLSQGWGLNLIVIIEVEVGTGEEVMIIIVKEFIIRIYVLEPNLFRLIIRVSCCRVCRRELKLITACLITL